ncbi:MAG: protein kinase [Anaerolineae bacterium]|nr:protein kinase [Anaerolineae bacterium]
MQPNLVGQKLGKYTIREMLGMGGMGAVYRAYQEDLKREVALKVIAPNFTAQEELVARFIREAQTAASLEHAHIVPIYDYGVINGQLYIVMRLLTGGTLSQRIDAARKSGKLPTPGECAALLDQLAGALDYAHERGVIHRDIKPGNIMFDNHGDAFLVDFGIAKAGDSTNLTRGSSVIGSPHYMAPEQWRGDPATAGTDQYALAVVLFTMLTGKLPFEAETPYAVMQLHINTPPPSPTLLRADLSPGLGLVMERALAKDGAARFPSMRAFAEAFRQSVGERMVGETGFFTRPLETTRTVVVPGGSGSQQSAAPAATAGAPSGSTSQSLSQTIRQQRVGLAVGLGAGLIVAVAAGVLLLMQNRGAPDLDATATAGQATLVGMANMTATAEGAALIASPTAGEVTDPPPSATPLPPTETLTPTWTPSLTPSATATPLPSATLTPSLSAEQIAASATAAHEAEIALSATERAVLTRTARASETAAAQATQAVETAAAQALETLIARNTATSAAIATNAAATLQAEQEATQAAINVAATLDAIVRNTRAANNAAASATAAAEQAIRDAQATSTAAAQAAQTATQAALDARATGTAEALSAAQTATQTALDAQATHAAVDQAATQTALDARATHAADQTATQTTFDAQATGTAEALWTALTATQTALDARATEDSLTASAQRLATESAATATRSAELLAAQATLSALQTDAANLTATAAAGPLTATAGGVSGTMAALNARATALRATATARAAIAVTSPTASVQPRVLVSRTPTPQVLASPTLLPSPTRQPQVGRPGIFSPGDLMERRVLTTQDDGFIRTVSLCCAASDLFVEIAFEMPNTTSYWDIGVAVREQEAPNQELRFYITSNRTWSYDLGAETQANGSHSAPFNTRPGTINRLTLVAFGETGIALLNGEIIAVLDFSAILNSGEVYIGTEFAAGSPPGIDVVIVSANVGALDPAFGPSDGILPHRPNNGGAESLAAEGVQRGSFIAQAVLGVPYLTDQNGWDIGFDFRKPGTNRFVRLIVDAMRQTWYLYDFNGEFTLSQSGPAGALRQGANDVNELILVAVREHGFLIVNGQPVGRFELPMIPGGGGVELGTGFFSGNEVDGEQTTFSGYTVWTFADQP